MVIVLKEDTTKEQKDQLKSWFQDQGLKVHESEGEFKTILGLVGDVENIDSDMVEMLDIVDRVTRISEPYKNANRKFHPKDTVVEIKGPSGTVKAGGGNFAVIAGPAKAGSAEQMKKIAESVKSSGATVLMGCSSALAGSPYKAEGDPGEIRALLRESGNEAGLPVTAEIMSTEDLGSFDDVDVILVGPRNMQNYELLREIGRGHKPVILKRGIANTLEELLMSAEYVMAGGNQNVILCESGIRTFEGYTKSTLDISAVPVLHKKTHLPVIVDPSNAAGRAELVGSLAMAAAAAGADGLMIEVHDDPRAAGHDGARAVTPSEFAAIMEKIKKIRELDI